MTARTVRIFRPARSAMQAGRAGTRDWIAEFPATDRIRLDPMMGWAGSADTLPQVRLRFPSKEAAVAWAAAQGHAIDLQAPQAPAVQPKSYADNFRPGRLANWTH